ncbi:excinuclease ABC subunit UvrA [Cryomorpha ignava]|uniref:UvrABC system protein A n=1 Tax=Cryomorpha ignava TaxID=101383 RepID=A0A7K3WW82_9FLAO|nr:excinuclease ABC subunit UvrA [Cryomorpha ignava]
MLEDQAQIEVRGARVHNLKNIDVIIPRNKLVVITGLSGSGKSSLAFDTLYAEGQRRYIETFSAYARQFLGTMERPDVDQINGLSPVISIEQKTISKSPRSTVGTITEIYDFLRLLYARVGNAYSYETGEKMVQYSEDQIVDLIIESYKGEKISILAPLVRGRKGHYRELFEQIAKQGYIRARIDGEITELVPNLKLDRYKIHDIEVVIDRLEVREDDKERLRQSVATAMEMGKGALMIHQFDSEKVRHFSKNLMCPTTGISYPEPEPNLFSFNSPYGVCSRCNGIGVVSEIDKDKLIPDDKKSIHKGALVPLGTYKNNWVFGQIDALLQKYDFKLTTPIKEIDDELIDKILHGTDETLKVNTGSGANEFSVQFEGIVNFIARQADENSSAPIQRWAKSFMNQVVCPKCDGARLRKEALFFKLDGKNIAQVSSMGIDSFDAWINNLSATLTKRQERIARDILKEITSRSGFLTDVGLDYLSLNRSAKTLSGGEAQRIRLATQIGSQLVGVLYILDEPSIGLHQRDNNKLIDSLKALRDIGNSVIVVEHDKEMILAADHVIDIGPFAGVHGGEIVAQGTGAEIEKMHSLTADYLTGAKEIAVPKKRRKGNGKKITLKGAQGHNLKDVNVDFPLGKFICVTGVSGSGKSTLINQTLYPLLNAEIYNGVKEPLPYKSITGLENIDKVIEIDQSPIGRTPRSNPATYTGLFTHVRTLFAEMPEAKIRGYKIGRFSFNTSGGRCETCKGAGLRTIEMNFMPDVYVECETCQGKRYNRETLEVRFKGNSISDVLNMTINQAAAFFSEIPKIAMKLDTLVDVGLGYLTLGQQSTTLSGGEAQRIKLASELSKKDTGSTFYIMDEPTTGLHFEDVSMLIDVLNRLVDNGNTVLVVEHNLDIIKVADYIIDIGPEGGDAGGYVVAKGTPEQIVKQNKGYTAKYLKEELK